MSGKNRKELKARWSKKEDDIVIYYPSSPDGCFLHDFLSVKRIRSGFVSEHPKNLSIKNYNKNLCFYEDKSFIEELKERGYDISTLKISIKKADI